MEELIAQIKDAVIAGKHKDIEGMTEKSLQVGLRVDDLINNAFIAAMDVVGQRFGEGEIFVPEMLVSAMTMKKGLEIIKPLLQKSGNQSKGKVILCTVKGDLHDIGKNLVAMMLEGAGFEVIDLGVDATVESVLQKINEIQPDILGLSALLTTTMPQMQKVIEELITKGIRDRIKVMIGGAPLSNEFAKDIGADAFGRDAAEAVAIARNLIAE
ncbi:MAG: corrinoid protein [Deltaproteobacteria bacterium]|jgi:5-methyltetrahydrofolate--homocysteine methyltransferase|nr:corrinoid protein [Deltaproteobacteria bacterium]